jgi:hypothetical protein
MPYAPVHARAALETDGSVTFSFTRRTRVGGGLRSGYDTAPLSEDSEAYEIDILDDQTDPQVVRILTGATPSITYDAADIAADWGTAPPATWRCRIHQISAQIGRGYSYDWQLEAA